MVGSAHMFADNYIDKEDNGRIFDVLIQYLTTEEVKLNAIDAEDPEVSVLSFTTTGSFLVTTLDGCILQHFVHTPR